VWRSCFAVAKQDETLIAVNKVNAVLEYFFKCVITSIVIILMNV